MGAVLKDRRFRRFFVGQALSTLGDTAMYLAMAIWAKQLTGSTAAAGMVFFAFTAAMVVAAPPFGYLADRVQRRPFLIVVNLVTAVMVLALLAVHDEHDVWILYVVAVAYGLSSTAIASARSGLVKDMVDDENLAPAIAALRTATDGLRLVAPLAGAGLFAALGGGSVALLDASTFVIAALALWSIHVDESQPVAPDGPFRRELTAGVRHIRTHATLRRLTLTVMVAFLTVGFLETVFVAVVDVGLHRPPTFLGVLDSVGGVGAIAGGLTAVKVLRRLGEVRAVGTGMAVVGAGTALLMTSWVSIAILGSLLMWVGVPWIVVGFSTLVQRATPPRLQGRVGAAIDVGIGSTQAVSIALGAALITIVDYRLLLAAVTVALAGAGAVLWRPLPEMMPPPADLVVTSS